MLGYIAGLPIGWITVYTTKIMMKRHQSRADSMPPEAPLATWDTEPLLYPLVTMSSFQDPKLDQTVNNLTATMVLMRVVLDLVCQSHKEMPLLE
jgi:hypothetical protein